MRDNQLKYMGLGRVELPTSRLSGVRSNHLSYRPFATLWKPRDGEFCKLVPYWRGVNRRPTAIMTPLSAYFHESVMRNGEYFLMPRNTARTIARRGRGHKGLANRRGFTLVELVVVTLVIGILAAIAIPRYSGSKDKGYLAAMKADLVSAAIYEEQYSAENHGQYFSGVATSVAPVEGFKASKDVTVTLIAVNILGTQLSEWTATAKHTQSPESCEMRGGIITCTTEDSQTTGILLLN